MWKKLTRRQFMATSSQAALAVSGVALGVGSCQTAEKSEPNGSSGATTVSLDISKSEYSPLVQPGGAVKVTVAGQVKPVIVVRISESDVAAFSSECTHAGCSVDLPDSGGTVRCPCHGSTFNQKGMLLGGLASRDLPSFAATIEGDIITVKI